VHEGSGPWVHNPIKRPGSMRTIQSKIYDLD
jgi:hypothetical protein